MRSWRHCNNAPSPHKCFCVCFWCNGPPPNGPGPSHLRVFYIIPNDTPQSVGLLWTSDQLVALTSTWQQQTDVHATDGIRTRHPSKRTATDLCLPAIIRISSKVKLIFLRLIHTYHTVSMPRPCNFPAMPCRYGFRLSFLFDLHSAAMFDSHIPCLARAVPCHDHAVLKAISQGHSTARHEHNMACAN
jgi:hypothetical protein